ncbi:MAG: hypothetical protein P1U68_09010 [Verrucomicrobiales bacterium]|nr:hypothetical protein [Verrucomicrobiales bacterium]
MRPFAFLLIASVFLASCGRVHTLTPVAETTEASLQAEWEGVWKMGEGVFHIAFDESSFGRFAWIEWQNDQFVMTEGRFNVLRSDEDDEMGFISLIAEEEGEEEEGYFFGGFKIVSPDSIAFWDTAELDRYESLINEAGLDGEVRGSGHSRSIVFKDGPGLASKVGDFGKYFELEDPFIMTRVVPLDSAD